MLADSFIFKLLLDYFIIRETKLNENFLCVHFNISNYETKNQSNRDKNGCELIEFISKGLIYKILNDYKTQLVSSFALNLQYPR